MIDVNVLNELIEDLPKYRAHKKGEINTEYESLLEHTQKTFDYFNYIWKKKKLDNFIDEFKTTVLEDLSVKAEKLWQEMIFAIPIFHDIGKINPDFQKNKMGNEFIEKNDKLSEIGSIHSLVSAVVYIMYFKAKIKKAFSKTDRDILNQFVLYNAYIISRHHSNLNDITEFINDLESSKVETIKNFWIEYAKGRIELETFKDEKALKKHLNNLFDEPKDYNTIYYYIYEKMMYSLLVASDYYATSEFMNGVVIKDIGNLNNVADFINIYEKSPVVKSVRKYKKEQYPQKSLESISDINALRSEIFCEAEDNLKNNYKEDIFYLEAPTGSGKSNTAMNLCFQLMQKDVDLKKIYYIYPFNTLVEQNIEILQNIFGTNTDIMQNIAVVNSLVPIKCNDEENYDKNKIYQEALLDRQFLNYPMIVSTHVSLFNTIFGTNRESIFGFYQLMNSVIVLDEIQSYKNTIWSEIIYFLKDLAKLLHMKIIIMSATLPNLDKLAPELKTAKILLPNSKKYFMNPLFKNRVEIFYDLLEKTCEDKELAFENLQEHILNELAGDFNKKILVEFISKNTALEFWKKLCESGLFDCDIEYMSGDDSLMERKRIIDKLKIGDKKIILVATQVIEAGVDIDMDIGYKNIARLDSEEQFMGRINRSCKRSGKVYFFKIDDYQKIYKKDIRINSDFTLDNEKMKDILLNKDFNAYYNSVMRRIVVNLESDLEEFLQDVAKLRWKNISKHMKLIEEDNNCMLVYLARDIEDEEGNIICGRDIWSEYICLSKDKNIDFAEKRVKLSRTRALMNNFLYQIKYNPTLVTDGICGEIKYIADGEKYFCNGKLDKKKVQGEIGDFVDFI